MEQCKYSDDIPKLIEKVSKIEKALYDNGQKGLITTSIKLNESVTHLTETTSNLATAVSGLVRFKDETIGGIKAKERIKINQRWVIGILITAILGLVTTIIAL
jgi:hypothetical protein